MKKNKSTIPFTIIMMIMIIGALFLLRKEETIKKYTAYIKINPLIKIDFSQTCTIDTCEEPIVTNYELVNEDAKSIYKDIKFKENSTLSEALILICETAKNNNIVFENVEVYSEWTNIGNYITDTSSWKYTIKIDEKPKEVENNKTNISTPSDTTSSDENKIQPDNTQQKNTNNNNVSNTNKETKTINFTYQYEQIELKNLSTKNNYKATIEKMDPITVKITGEKELIEKYTIEELGSYKLYVNLSSLTEGTHKVKLQTESTNKDFTYNVTPTKVTIKIEKIEDSSTKGKINLNDNVLYGEADVVYKCDNCIPDSLITKIKNTKGYREYGVNNSSVWYKSIALSEPYNDPQYRDYYDFESDLINAGAESVGGSYGEPEELLTEEICKLYKLSCDRW